MSNQFLKLRRSAVPGKIPTTSSIDFGEIALNTYDGLAFMKKSGSNGEEIVTLGTGTGGGNMTGSQYYIPIFNTTSSLVTSSIYQSGSFTGIRTTTPSSDTNPDVLLVDGSDLATTNIIGAHGNSDNYIQLNVQNFANTTNASSDIVATANNGTENTYYIDMGINSEGYSNANYVGSANDAYVYSTGNDLYIGNAAPDKRVIIFNGGLDAINKSKVFIHETGVVSINTSDYNTTNPPSLQIAAPNNTTYNLVQANGSVDNYLQTAITNASTGTNASADIVAYNNIDPVTQSMGYIDMGINSTNYIINSTYPGDAGHAYLFTDSDTLIIGTISGSSDELNLFVGGVNADTNSKLKLRASNIHSLTGSLTATSFTGSLFGTASFSSTASYGNNGFIINTSQFNNTSSATTAGTTVISSIATGSYTSCFYNYTIASASNARSGQVMSVWNGSAIKYTEITTTDIGNTATASFAVALSGSNINLNFTAPGIWTVKSIANLL